MGGFCFIVPGLVVILALATLFLAERPPGWVSGAALGADAAVPVVALAAALSLVPASWRRAGQRPAGAGEAAGAQPGSGDASEGTERMRARPAHLRWILYLAAGGASGALLGPWLVLVLAACGLIEVAVRSRALAPPRPPPSGALLLTAAGGTAVGGLAALAWVAFKVGALSYGGGFVIIPLMQRDAVHTYHWMTSGQFLTAVALGQVTPGPVVQTVAVVGYAAAGIGGGLLASAIAFAPSFAFVLGGGRYFDRLRANAGIQAFLTGAGPAAIGAIAGAAVPLGLALAHVWQVGVLAVAAIWLVVLRRGVVTAIVGAAGLGVIAFLAGGPVT